MEPLENSPFRRGEPSGNGRGVLGLAVPFFCERPDIKVGSPLAPREVECLRLLAKGFARRDAAHALGIGFETFKHHVHRAYFRLGADCLVTALERLGWLAIPD